MKNRPDTQLWITPGATVRNEGRDYVILALADINLVLARDVETKQKVLLKIGDLGPPKEIKDPDAPPPPDPDLFGLTDEMWEVAQHRRKIIDPLLTNYYRRADKLAGKIAASEGVSRATLYRWVADFRNSGLLSALLPGTRFRGGKGGSRISKEVAAIIDFYLENEYFTEQKPTIAAAVQEIRRLCSNAKLPLPAHNTIRRRIREKSTPDGTKRRHGAAVAYSQHEPIKGTIPDAEWPLAVAMIDHTKLPVIIVDDVHRKPINRAWITLAIDVFARVCLGMFLSLDAPSAMSAGMCIAHAILPKERWLRQRDLSKADWPLWGVPGALHMDNAREFRGDMIKAACREYDIDVHLRPVKKPRYGTHIERLMGTVSEGLKTLKGATFSGPEEKGVYDAEGNACMTFSELENWLILFFTRYHIEKHGGIGMSPLQKWREGLLGTKGKPGRGLPARRLDEEVLRINFTPFEERTIQNYGVQIDHVHYYHDVLRPWINAPDPNHPRHKRLFRFHRDPRAIAPLYFFDEIAQRYFPIPFRDTGLQPVSIWELRAAQEMATKRGIPLENERAVFEIINEQRAIEVSAAQKTKSARHSQQRRTEHKKQQEDKETSMPNVSTAPPTRPPPAVRGYNPDEIKPLDDD